MWRCDPSLSRRLAGWNAQTAIRAGLVLDTLTTVS
jgi:hypothetical protein